jgi:alkanesulfonate monooxygenase SsuD/methylene tetrahydromethanopterin reductase-like flavin-dependent oxidoreductase (luciferase family)
MKLGLSCGLWIYQLSPEVYAELASRVEAAGYESLWVSDHFSIPAILSA